MYRQRALPSTPRHDPDKLDPVAVLKRTPGPFVAEQCLVVELDQNAPRIEPATGGEFAQGRRRADLPRAAVDENAEALLDGFRHKLN